MIWVVVRFADQQYPSIIYKRFLLQVTKTGLGRSARRLWTQLIKSSTGESNPYHQNGNLRRYHYTSAAVKAILVSIADIAFFSNFDRIKEIDRLKLESSPLESASRNQKGTIDFRQLSKSPRPPTFLASASLGR